MLSRLGAVLTGICISLLALSLTAWADPTKKGEDLKTFKDETSLAEQHMARQFNELMQNILKLRDRLKRSANAEDRERAVILDKVLESAQGRGISTQFEGVVDYVVKNRLGNPTELEVLSDKSKKLADDLRYIIDLMRMDTATNKMREKQDTLKKIIADIEAAILKQKLVQAQTEIGKTEKKELQGNQKGTTDDVSKIGKQIDKYNNPDGQGKEKDHKGDMKDGGKQSGSKAEAKDQGPQKDGPTGQAKDGKGQEKDAPPSTAKGSENKDPKDPKNQDPKGKEGDKTASAKSGDPKDGGQPGAKGSEPKGKEGKGGEPSQAKDSKGSPSGSPKDQGGKDDPKAKDPGEKTAKDQGDPSSKKEKKKDDPAAQAKDKGKDDKKDGQQASAKDSKSGGDPKKAGDQKADGKPSPGESKPGEESKGQAQAKSAGQPMPSSPMPPQPPSQAKGGDSPPPPPGGQQPPPDQVGKKQVQDANDYQKKAEDEIAKENKKKASDDQGKAVAELEKAKKKLEELLKQLREEELERLLAALQQRCEKMLAMQIAVFNGTVGVDGSILNNADKKANRENQAESLKLSDNEKDIVVEASKAIELLEAEGTAVAFPEVFQQVREDMKHVQRRLDVTDVGKVTQAIEQDMIDTLKEMIDALKKAKKELDDKKNPPPGEPKAGGPPPDQKLLDQIAELKMIRSMQLRVNTRTQTYGRQYKGEQAQEPGIRKEIIQLGDRQEKIYEVTNKIAKGDNK